MDVFTKGTFYQEYLVVFVEVVQDHPGCPLGPPRRSLKRSSRTSRADFEARTSQEVFGEIIQDLSGVFEARTSQEIFEEVVEDLSRGF